MTLSANTYIISNAATPTGNKVANILSDRNCHIILAGPNYGELETMKKELQPDESRDIKVALLEPSKDIDWQNLKESLDKLEYGLAGIIHVHDIETVNQEIFETSHEQFTDMMNVHLWGTYLSAKHLIPMLDNGAGQFIHVVNAADETESPMFYTMITTALDAMLRTIQYYVENEQIQLKYLNVGPDTIEHQLINVLSEE